MANMKKEVHKRLTPLRALNLLNDIQNAGWNAEYRLRMARDALTEHIKAHLRKGR